MKKTTARKLGLAVSTIRSLTPPQASAVQGGRAITGPTLSATWGEPGCFPCYPEPTITASAFC
jgi:hypothetical protein